MFAIYLRFTQVFQNIGYISFRVIFIFFFNPNYTITANRICLIKQTNNANVNIFIWTLYIYLDNRFANIVLSRKVFKSFKKIRDNKSTKWFEWYQLTNSFAPFLISKQDQGVKVLIGEEKRDISLVVVAVGETAFYRKFKILVALIPRDDGRI